MNRRSGFGKYLFALILKALALALAIHAAAPALADEVTCGSLRNAYGPIDYRKANPASLQLVEGAHFTQEVESLKAGSTSYLGGDLDYTLRAFPNHPRALASMMALQFKAKTNRPQGTKWPVACYFDRAVRFAPDDGKVRTILGVYLMRLNQTAQAMEQFKVAEQLGEDSGNLHYNLGLAYFDVSDFPNAVEQAKKAYALGFTLPGLKNKLVRAGKWPAE